MLDKTKRLRKEYVSYNGKKVPKYVYNCKDCNLEIFKTPWEENNSGIQYCYKCSKNHRVRLDACKFDKLGHKHCKGCDRYLPVDKFIKRSKSGYSTKCSKCHNLKEFGINSLQYENLLLVQNNNCAICNKPEQSKDKHKETTRSLAVDHDHITGKVRGLLCTNCNILLGQAKDNIEILNKAIKYLKNE